MYAVIVGGGKVGRNLAKDLLEDGMAVSIVEKDSGKCENIASKLNALVINGDGADYSVLESAGSRGADYLIAATGTDEVNFVVCLLAKVSFSAKTTLARVNDIRNEGIFKKSGVDFVLTTPYIISKMMHEIIRCKDCGFPFIIPTFLDRKSKFEIVRFIIKEGSPSIGKKISELKFPKDSLIITVIRSGEIMIPSGKSVINKDDTLYIITRRDSLEHIKGTFSVGE
ncbi:MAG TPA: NAD-binding protein [Caldisericia bacterium]|nr:NAD-binding protein [Caldisericia bacterium]HPO28682.1 NAD-binding protein [Caldisericia bacterium]HRU02161.1 NAD-binding protein [Victivallales bacterium]